MGRGSRRGGSDGLSHMFSWLPELVSCLEGLSISSYTASGSLLCSATAPYASLSVVSMAVPSTKDTFRTLTFGGMSSYAPSGTPPCLNVP